MANLLYQPHTVFESAEQARAALACLTWLDDATATDDDGWMYRLSTDPAGSGRAILKAYDEDGEEVGKF